MRNFPAACKRPSRDESAALGRNLQDAINKLEINFSSHSSLFRCTLWGNKNIIPFILLDNSGQKPTECYDFDQPVPQKI